MPDHSILVRNIRHLTDARYFAAMGVEWMSIHLTNDPASFMLWHAIRGWIEGVKLVAEVDVKDESLLARCMIDARPDGLMLSTSNVPEGVTDVQLFFETDLSAFSGFPENSTFVLPYRAHANQNFFKALPHHGYLQAEWTMELVNEVLDSGYQGGFCLLGGDESLTGVRDYGPMNEILDRLLESK